MSKFILRWTNESVTCLTTANVSINQKSLELVLAGSQSGRVSVWRVDYRRASVDVQLHTASVLALELLEAEHSAAALVALLSLARDGRLLYYTLERQQLFGSSRTRPDVRPANPQPVLLLSVNAITFCGFALHRVTSGKLFVACLPPDNMSAIHVHSISFSSECSPSLGKAVPLDPASLFSRSSSFNSTSSASSSIGSVMALRFCGSCLLAALENGHLTAWIFTISGSRSESKVEALEFSSSSSTCLQLFCGPILAFDVCPASRVGAAGSASREFVVFGVREAALAVLMRVDLLTASPLPIDSLSQKENPEESAAVCSALAFSADGTRLAVAFESSASASPESSPASSPSAVQTGTSGVRTGAGAGASGSHMRLELFDCGDARASAHEMADRIESVARAETGSVPSGDLRLRLRGAHCTTGRLRTLAFSQSNNSVLFGANESCIEAYT